MEKTHDTLTELGLGTPIWFIASAWLLPVGLFSQFASAGLGLFLVPDLLGLHGAIGSVLLLPVIGLMTGAALIRRLHGFRWCAGVVLALYLVQVALAAGAVPVLLSFHPANGALLLSASLVLLSKIERRRAGASTFLVAAE